MNNNFKFKVGDKVWRLQNEHIFNDGYPIKITDAFYGATGNAPDTTIPKYAFVTLTINGKLKGYGLAYPRETDLFKTKRQAEVERLKRMATRLGYKVVK